MDLKMNPRELLRKIAKGISLICAAESNVTDEQLEFLLRTLQHKWKFDRPFRMSSLN